jgi:hypothetical protein
LHIVANPLHLAQAVRAGEAWQNSPKF